MEKILLIIAIILLPLITIGAIILAGIKAINRDKNKRKKIAHMSPEELQKYLEQKRLRSIRLYKENQKIREINHESEYGSTNTAMACPHCQTIGKIRTKEVKRKKGVSGGKATAAILTGGVSLLAVGLSRKEGATQAHCDNCNNTWFF